MMYGPQAAFFTELFREVRYSGATLVNVIYWRASLHQLPPSLEQLWWFLGICIYSYVNTHYFQLGSNRDLSKQPQ